MSAAEVRPGRYRISAEVDVLDTPASDTHHVRFPDGKTGMVRTSSLTWERLPDPEPDWQPGHRVTDADGDEWLCLDRRTHPDSTMFWYLVGDGEVRADQTISRPLTVTHEPKPVRP